MEEPALSREHEHDLLAVLGSYLKNVGLLRQRNKLNVAHDDVLDIDRESLLARGLLVVSRAELDRRVRQRVLDDIPLAVAWIFSTMAAASMRSRRLPLSPCA